MATLYLTHEVCIEHDTGPGHPERPDRLRAIGRVMEHEIFDDLVRAQAPLADIEDIALAHPGSYIDAIREAVPEEGLVRVDSDTVLSPKSWDAALRAVGSGIEAVDQVMTGKVSNAFCAIRPCGHHAEPTVAMGFCVFNNIAIAGLHARASHGAERIAVVDFDVHHGNGTQVMFWSDKDLFFGSTHQMPLFPGTGAVTETGVGNIWNAPLRAGDDGTAFRNAMETRILPALRKHDPDIILISAGFDAHERDPLASLRLVEDDFAWITRKLAEIADKHCEGRIVSMLEGGYDLEGLAKSVAVHVKALMDAGA
ncbi:MAG: histone deacetylase family protein [Alphaproteobacteria bacterium]|nr:MAG: histone deacetylase family protein [Alphaproteobacteria bacterium]